MVSYSSEDSSDGEAKLFDKKDNRFSVKRLESGEASKAHGIVVANRTSSGKSPPKQSRLRNDSEISENPSVEQVVQNYKIEDNSSKEEQVIRTHTAKVKMEQLSSDAESEDENYESRGTAQARTNSSDNKFKDIVSENLDESIITMHDADESRNSFPQAVDKKAIQRRRVSIKKEAISPEDEETMSRKSPDKFNNEEVFSQRIDQNEFNNSEQGMGGNSSDSEIPPSQYWLHQYKEVERKDDDKGPVKKAKKTSPIKNLEADENVDKKKRASIGKKELSQGKPPPRITKTEIVSTKYMRTKRQIVDDEDESSSSNGKDGNGDVERKEREGSVGLRESSNNDESDEKSLRENEKFESSKSSEDKSDAPRDMLEREFSPSKKRQSPRKTQASPKRKLSSEPKVLNNDSGIEVKSNLNKKNTPKRNLANILNDKPLKTRENIYDADTTSEEEGEKRIERKKKPDHFVLALENPKKLSKKTSNPNGRQMVLVRKTNEGTLKSNESKSQSSPRKVSISHQNDVYEKSSSGDSSSNVVPSRTIEKKPSPKRKKQDSDSPGEVAGPAPTTLKRKLDLDDTPHNTMNIPMKSKIKHSENNESNSSEIKLNKRAKLMPLEKEPEPEPQPEPQPEISDSDGTDSLTKLNTTLNKSMALMKDKPEIEKINKSRKSVSINTKRNVSHIPNDSRTQKSILKKPEPIATTDSSESAGDSQEQTVQPINVVVPKIIKRPSNLQNFKDQESLAYDSTKTSFRLEDVSEDDEIYIMELPRTVDPRELKGQTIKLSGKNKLEIGNQIYETSVKDATNISCVFRTDGQRSSYQTVNLRPAGCINVRQKLSKSLHIELSPRIKRTVPFPENLKVRHPLFGSDYEDKIVFVEKKISKKTSRSIIKQKTVVKTNEASWIEKKPIKLKNVEKHKTQKIESPQESNKSENTSRDKAARSRKLQGDDLESSGSDSDESFFQKVKRENIGKPEKRKKSKNLLSILNLDETALTIDPPVHSEETIIKRKELSLNKKLGSSLNSSAMTNASFDVNTKDSKFFSSTPIKFENDEKNYEGEILANKVRKRKTHGDVTKSAISHKKMEAN